MNSDQAVGNGKQWTGKIRQRWGKLTEDDLAMIDGKREELSGLLQSRYGFAKEQVEQDLDEFARNLRHSTEIFLTETLLSAGSSPTSHRPGPTGSGPFMDKDSS